jgi:hypothetical protein
MKLAPEISDMISSTVQVSLTTAWRATKKLHLLPCKIRQFHAIEEGYYRGECSFITAFCRQDMTLFLNWYLHWLLMKVDSMWAGISVLRVTCIEPVLIWNMLLKYLKSSGFRGITPYSLLKVNWCFGGTCRLHLQGWRISEARNKHENMWQVPLHDQKIDVCCAITATWVVGPIFLEQI